MVDVTQHWKQNRILRDTTSQCPGCWAGVPQPHLLPSRKDLLHHIFYKVSHTFKSRKLNEFSLKDKHIKSTKWVVQPHVLESITPPTIFLLFTTRVPFSSSSYFLIKRINEWVDECGRRLWEKGTICLPSLGLPALLGVLRMLGSLSLEDEGWKMQQPTHSKSATASFNSHAISTRSKKRCACSLFPPSMERQDSRGQPEVS